LRVADWLVLMLLVLFLYCLGCSCRLVIPDGRVVSADGAV